MSLGAILEPLVVVSLLAGGTLVNRNISYSPSTRDSTRRAHRRSSLSTKGTLLLESLEDVEAGVPPHWEGAPRPSSPNSPASTLVDFDDDLEPAYRSRTLKFLRWKRTVKTPSTEAFRDRLLSRLLRRFPFLVETWYWALIYWVR